MYPFICKHELWEQIFCYLSIDFFLRFLACFCCHTFKIVQVFRNTLMEGTVSQKFPSFNFILKTGIFWYFIHFIF